MQQVLLTVRYRLHCDPADFRAGMTQAAQALAAVPGLVWKIWGFDDEVPAGLSAYLFRDPSAARAFAEGPMIDGLRRRPEVAEVRIERALVDPRLSFITAASEALRPGAYHLEVAAC